MKCYYHPEVDATGTCTNCGKAICQNCAVNVGGRFQCQQCLASGAVSQTTSTLPTNSLAIISLILGVLGLMGCCCGGSIGGILFGLPASITGWIARKQILQAGKEQQGLQLATVGLVFGITELILSLVVLVLYGSVLGLTILSDLLQ